MSFPICSPPISSRNVGIALCIRCKTSIMLNKPGLQHWINYLRKSWVVVLSQLLSSPHCLRGYLLHNAFWESCACHTVFFKGCHVQNMYSCRNSRLLTQPNELACLAKWARLLGQMSSNEGRMSSNENFKSEKLMIAEWARWKKQSVVGTRVWTGTAESSFSLFEVAEWARSWRVYIVSR